MLDRSTDRDPTVRHPLAIHGWQSEDYSAMDRHDPRSTLKKSFVHGIDWWKKLDSDTVSDITVNSFKNRLQRLWLHDEFVFGH